MRAQELERQMRSQKAARPLFYRNFDHLLPPLMTTICEHATIYNRHLQRLILYAALPHILRQHINLHKI